VASLPREVRIPWALSWLAVVLFLVHLVLATFWPMPSGQRSAVVVFGSLAVAEVGVGAIAALIAAVVLVIRLVRSRGSIGPHDGKLLRSILRGLLVIGMIATALAAA
jgi:hypothetical protein